MTLIAQRKMEETELDNKTEKVGQEWKEGNQEKVVFREGREDSNNT